MRLKNLKSISSQGPLNFTFNGVITLNSVSATCTGLEAVQAYRDMCEQLAANKASLDEENEDLARELAELRLEVEHLKNGLQRKEAHTGDCSPQANSCTSPGGKG